MNDFSEKQLDQMLKDWSARRAAGDDKLNALRRQIQEAVANENKPSVAARPSRTRGVIAAVVGSAVVLVVVLGVRSWLPTASQEPAPGNPVHFVAISDGEVGAKATLLGEMRLLFGDRFVSLTEYANDVQLEVVDGSNAGREKFLLCRLAMVSRRGENSDWQLDWTVDVLSQHERIVDVGRFFLADKPLSMWTYVLPDGQVAMDIDPESLPPTTDGQGSYVVEPGVPVRILTVHRDGVEYRLLQNVTIVDGQNAI